jgi:hypothetical protein
MVKKQSQLPATDQYGHSNKKVVLTPEQMEAAAARLYTRSLEHIQKRNKEYEEAISFQMNHNDKAHKQHGELSEGEQKAISKLYQQPLDRKAATQQSLEKKFAPPQPATKVVAPEEQDAITDRLYHQAMAKKKQGLEQSEKRVYLSKTSPRRVLDKEHLALSLESLYKKAMEKKKEWDQKLEEKYSWKLQSPRKPLSKEEEDALAKRLSAKAS